MLRLRIIILCGAVLGLIGNASSQVPDSAWSRIYKSTNSVQQAEAVIQLEDGGYLIGVNTGNVAFADSQKIWIVRTDSTGSIVGTRIIGSDDELTHCYAMYGTSDTAVVMCGYRKLGKSLFDPMHPFFLKMNQDGDTMWTRTYDWPADDDAVDVKQTSDGGYILTGSSLSYPLASLDYFVAYLLKTDSAGNEIWKKGYHGELIDKNCYGVAVIQAQDSGYIVAARAEGISSKTDVLIIRTDSTGDTLWQRIYGGLEDDYVFSLIETSEGDFLATGNSYSVTSGRDVFFLKIAPDGTERWFRTVPRLENDGATSVCEANGGGYIVTGWCDQSPYVKSDLYIVRTDTGGSIQWSRSYGGEFTEYGTGICPTGDNGYIVCGYKILSSGGNSGAYIIKLEQDPLVGVLSESNTMPSDFALLQNYPNPFNPTTKVSFVISHSSLVTLKVYDVLGREVATLVNGRKEAGRYETEFDGSNLKSGVYFYRFVSGNDFAVKKLILVK